MHSLWTADGVVGIIGDWAIAKSSRGDGRARRTFSQTFYGARGAGAGTPEKAGLFRNRGKADLRTSRAVADGGRGGYAGVVGVARLVLDAMDDGGLPVMAIRQGRFALERI